MARKLLSIYSSFVAFIYKFPFLVPFWDYWSSTWVSLIKFGIGGFAADVSTAARPELPLKLYEFEACPFCRKVRETISILDLDAIIYPCPRETLKQYAFSKDSRFRPVAEKLGGKLQFPFLVDDNTGKKLYESEDINKYLWETYGQGASKPLPQRVIPKRLLSLLGLLASLFRPLPHMGVLRTPSKEPEKLLVLYGYEADPNSRLVREALCTLELPYLLHTIAIGSPKRSQRYIANFAIPYFIDPNSDFMSSNARDILNYLNTTYKTGDTVQESWDDYSTKGASSTHGTVDAKKTL